MYRKPVDSRPMNLRITYELAEREIREHFGRGCEITMKKTGEKFVILRTGYGPMESPHSDPHKMIDENGNTVVECDDLYGIGDYIAKHYC